MVNPMATYLGDGKRFSSRINEPYFSSGYMERKTGHAIRQQEYPQGIMMQGRELAQDNGPQRKRISVACTRCRRRKIRCSGDSGNGEGCTNCQSSHKEHECYFARVGALPPAQFHYDLNTARKNPPRLPNGMPVMPNGGIFPEGLLTAANDPNVYRPTSQEYAVGPRVVYPATNWSGEYADDEASSYPLYSPGYQQPMTLAEQPQYVMPCRVLSPAVTRTPPPQQPAVYREPSVSYVYATESSITATAMSRSDTQKSLTYVGSVDSVPARPVAASNSNSNSNSSRECLVRSQPPRTVPGWENATCRTGSLSSAYSKSSQAPTEAATSPNSSLADFAPSYGNYETSPALPSYATSTSMAAPMTNALASASGLYLASVTSMPVAASTEGMLRTSSSVPDFTYHYEDTTKAPIVRSGSAHGMYSSVELVRPAQVLRSQKIKVSSSPRLASSQSSPEIKIKRSPSLSAYGA